MITVASSGTALLNWTVQCVIVLVVGGALNQLLIMIMIS